MEKGPLYLQKFVKVSEPNYWYGEDTITVKMWTLPTEPDTVRILFESIDDFMVYKDFSKWDQKANWEWCKKWFWDKIPETVSMDWLYSHGYLNF